MSGAQKNLTHGGSQVHSPGFIAANCSAPNLKSNHKSPGRKAASLAKTEQRQRRVALWARSKISQWGLLGLQQNDCIGGGYM